MTGDAVLPYGDFARYVREAVPQFRARWLNPRQEEAVRALPHPPTFIVAGPGTGKTTVLALRVLKLILVDGIAPAGIMATTFTRKAAGELRSRILAWGYATVSHARNATAGQSNVQDWLAHVDINGVQAGTVDSLAEEFLALCRPPGGINPATIETFLARAIMRRYALFPGGRFQSPDLEVFLRTFVSSYPGPSSFPVKLGQCLSFADRVRHDSIDLVALAGQDPGRRVLLDTLTDYFAYLETNHFADFARLEQLMFQRLQQGQLERAITGIRAILVDEFQDTNYLQEQLYFELCRRTGASLTVVGDDDQSVFRFRGATVEIFADFENRIASQLGLQWRPQRVDLVENYRSSSEIVAHTNYFAQLDPNYQGARVPNKQALQASAQHSRIQHPPALGMFRPDCQTLARDLANFLHEVFRGPGAQIHCAHGVHTISRSDDGDFGDAVLLAHSAQEYRGGDPQKPRLPLLLRNILENIYQVPVFNPRGRSLFEIRPVRRLLGLALLCIDRGGTILQGIQQMSPTVRQRIMSWRQDALTFASSNPPPGRLTQFVQSWENRAPTQMPEWPPEWPLLELVFTLISWIPELQNEPEGQVYLEAIARTISEAGQFSPYRAQIIHGAGPHDRNSVTHAIREVFATIADGNVEVDEEIMPHVPRNYFPIMTIHQAKGLEFPFVIVDVGSDFRTNNVQQRRFRFPQESDTVHRLENIVAPYCPIGNARTRRNAIDRAWDDLQRLYYVAYSRAQNVLLLVGLTSQLGPNPRVRAVSLGDLQDSSRAIDFIPQTQWRPGLPPGNVALI